MKLLFVYDHRFYRDASGAAFTSGSLPAHVWDRYLEHFDSVEVIARDGGPLPAGSHFAPSNAPWVTFNLIPNMTSYRQQLLRPKGLKERIRSSIQSASAVLIRLPSELGFIAAAECRRLGKPYAVEVVGCAWDALVHHGSLAGRIYAPFFFLRTRNAVRHAPLALYVTSRWLQGRYPTAGDSYPVSDVEIAALDEAEIRARQLRLDAIAAGKPPQLGTVASLRIRSKGIQTALAALEVLRNEGFELPYRVLGGGDRAPWIALAESHGVADLVSFDGVRPAGHGVRTWLDSIDIHLQPSFHEGLPRATVEAMSRGIACIGSTCGGIPELLPQDRLHSPGDVAGLAGRIRDIATNPDKLAEAGKRDLETASAFQPERLAATRSEFLAKLRAAAR